MENILEVRGLKKYFEVSGGNLHAVDDVSFELKQAETLGVVGESGCGKSTLGRVVLGLLDATDGSILFEGKETARLNKNERFSLRKNMQMIFQDPYSSLDPRMCVRDIIAQPLLIYRCLNSKDEIDNRVADIMQTVGLDIRFAFSYPHELDGGRRQRVGIGRALALNPKFIVCDEPVSALDVSIQAQILNLMQDLQQEKKFSYLFITHDLSVVKHISNNIMVMYLGGVIEKCESDQLFEHPLHPYTKGLLAAIPIPVPGAKRERELLKGELSSPINPKPGCRFVNRCFCPTDLCGRQQPSLKEILPGHFVACHHVERVNDM
ncbi:ABC transporter ATP-binding protein [Synergistales bacterium]|nr:ABC transporter ATP-binding protein [Synergistales bacterium]